MPRLANRTPWTQTWKGREDMWVWLHWGAYSSRLYSHAGHLRKNQTFFSMSIMACNTQTVRHIRLYRDIPVVFFLLSTDSNSVFFPLHLTDMQRTDGRWLAMSLKLQPALTPNTLNTAAWSVVNVSRWTLKLSLERHTLKVPSSAAV